MGTVTNRDRVLFESIGRYGILTTSQIEQRIFPGVQSSTVLRRLRALEEGHWIYRIKALESGELVWLLTRKGEELAQVNDQMVRPNRNGVTHDVELTALRMRLESIGLGANFIPEWSIRRRTFRHERGRSDEHPVVPDGIFTAKIWDNDVLTFALELEINAKTTQRYGKIFDKYLRRRNLDLVWYFVKTESFGHALMAKWKEEGERPRYNLNQSLTFIFTVLSEFQTDPRNAKIHFPDRKTNRVEVFFGLEKPQEPPAQPVGREAEKIQATQN